MGRPWVDHESWELVDEATEVAGRDVGALLLDADADELQGHPQRPADHVRLQPDGARRRRAPRPRAQLLRRPQPRRVHRAHRHRRARLRRRRAPRRRARRRDARGRARHSPGTMAAVLGLDDDQVEVACRRADGDVWVANFNAPGQVVIAGSPEGVAAAGAIAKELGAKKVMPLPVSGAFHTPFMAPARDRLRKAIADADPRDTEVPVVSNVDALPHDDGERVGQPAVGAARQSRCAGSTACSTLADARRHRLRRARARAACSPAWPSARVDGARTISVATPEDLDKLLEWVARPTPPTGARHRGRAPLRRRAPRRQPGRRRLHARAGHRRRRPRSRSAPCSATSASTRCARRSPACCRATSRSTASGSRRASRSPGCGRADMRRRPTCQRSDPASAAPSSPAGAPRCPDKMLTNHDLEEMSLDTSDEWIVERTGIRERRVGGTTAGLSIEAGRPALEMAGRRPGDDRRPRPGHHDARPAPCRPRRPRSQHELGLRCGAFDINAACSGFVVRRSSSAHGLIAMGAERVLVIGTDTLSRITDWDDRNTAILFADGSGAVVLEAVDGPRPAARLGPRRRRHRRALPLRRGRRRHPDGRQGGLPPGRADHGRLGREVDGRTPASPPTTSPSSSPTRPTSGSSRPPATASASRWSGPPSCSTAPATRRRRRSRSPSSTRSTTAGSQQGDLVLLVGFGAGMTAASACSRWGGGRRR